MSSSAWLVVAAVADVDALGIRRTCGCGPGWPASIFQAKSPPAASTRRMATTAYFAFDWGIPAGGMLEGELIRRRSLRFEVAEYRAVDSVPSGLFGGVSAG
jgi:hypothetical protein